jgi:hypothetical protein
MKYCHTRTDFTKELQVLSEGNGFLPSGPRIHPNPMGWIFSLAHYNTKTVQKIHVACEKARFDRTGHRIR